MPPTHEFGDLTMTSAAAVYLSQVSPKRISGEMLACLSTLDVVALSSPEAAESIVREIADHLWEAVCPWDLRR